MSLSKLIRNEINLFKQIKITNMETLKQTIKQLAAGQSVIKNQRKSVHFTGTRTLSPRQAWQQHRQNRESLRHMNLAYGTLLGKTIEEMEPTGDHEFNQSIVDALVEQYKENVK